MNTPVFEAGMIVGRFRIIRKIAVGGMGVVYEARDTELGRPVALKHPRLDVGDAEMTRRRFLREARAASRLLHPNIVPIFEVFEAEGLPWLAMELVEGESLKERMKRLPPMPLPEVLRHAEGLASALSEAHRMGVLHRDLKPANILLDARGRARLMDFGLAHPISSGDRDAEETVTRLTADGFIVGTPGYISPEQALGRDLDGRSDIFCLGVILYEMCSGRPPFGSRESDSWLDLLLHTPPGALPPAADEAVPEELKAVLSKAMAKKPADRYEDADSMREDLSRIRRRLKAGTTRDSMRKTRFRRGVSFALIGVLLAAVGVLAWFWRGVFSSPGPRSPWIAVRLTHDPAWAADPALSPDETLIAYASGRSGGGDIWLIDRKGGKPLQLTHHPVADRRPAWSPDGSTVYFTSFRSGEAAIWKIPRLGGTPELVLHNADDADLSPDGLSMAFVRPDSKGYERVGLISLDDPAQSRFVTDVSRGFWHHRNPKFSPDGRKLVYQSSRSVWLVALDGSGLRCLTPGSAVDSWPAWIGGDVLFSRYLRGTRSFWRVNVNGTGMKRLTPGSGCESQTAPTSDGRSIYYSTLNAETRLHLLNLRNGTDLRLGDAGHPDWPAIAPDGKSVVFTASYRDGDGIYLQTLDGGRPTGMARLLLAGRGAVFRPRFSPDGRWIAYYEVIDGQRDIWLLPLRGGKPIRFTNDEGLDADPCFSPDGGHLAFTSDRGGLPQIWWATIREGRRSGEPELLSSGQTAEYQPRISPDGLTLACFANNGHEESIHLISLRKPTEFRVLARARRINDLWWEADGRSLLASGEWKGNGLSLRRISLADGSSQESGWGIDFGQGGSGQSNFASAAISLSPEGSLLAYTETLITSDIWALDRGPGP